MTHIHAMSFIVLGSQDKAPRTLSLSYTQALNTPYTVKPPIMDPPTRGQPPYKGHWLRHQLKLL